MDVIKQIKEKWPKKIVDYWDDRALQFLGLCNYNVELALENVSEGSNSLNFMQYANKINTETKNTNPNNV